MEQRQKIGRARALLPIMLLAVCCATLSRGVIGQARGQPEVRDGLGVVSYLDLLGKKYGCYFTFESFFGNGVEPTHTLQNNVVAYRFSLPQTKSNSETPRVRSNPIKELERLRRIIPGFSYSVDLANQRIIHVIDSGLVARKDYALNESVARIDFEGKLFRLPSEIGRTGLPISSPPFTFTGDLGLRDFG